MPDDISPRDRYAIYDTMNRYAYCLDTADGAGLAATFTREGVVETGGRTYQGHKELAEFCDTAVSVQMPGFFGRQHHVQPVRLQKTPEGYEVTSYWRVVTSPAGGQSSVILMGYYEDACVLEDGEWRFARKRILRWDSDTAPIIGR